MGYRNQVDVFLLQVLGYVNVLPVLIRNLSLSIVLPEEMADSDPFLYLLTGYLDADYSRLLHLIN